MPPQRPCPTLDPVYQAYPSTKIVLMALLKTTKYSVAQANQWYSWLGMQPGVLFLDCSRSVDPFDKVRPWRAVKGGGGGVE